MLTMIYVTVTKIYKKVSPGPHFLSDFSGLIKYENAIEDENFDQPASLAARG